ncbi:MAG TPA: TylF/MycF/NovP-related O-methyltransferase [Bryobacterales bacterium]|nr:TylF/MycF/NovP-related O-methyltransferase [Bryobacterales bacterium]
MKSSGEELYLDLLKKCLTRQIFPEEFRRIETTRQSHKLLNRLAQRLFSPLGLALVRRASYDPVKRDEGMDTHPQAETMSGIQSLDHLERCVTEIIRQGVPGDLIETGTWRGGACILMRAICRVYQQTDRTIWVADSFQGHPPANPALYPADARPGLWRPFYQVSLDEVQENFARYGLLDDQVKFLAGWFKDTLPAAPIERLALMRLHGDLYESTMDSLVNLYPKLSVGGYVIVGDYILLASKTAVTDFRNSRNITAPLLKTGGVLEVTWQKTE